MPRQVATIILCALTLSIPAWSSAQAIRAAPVLVSRQAGTLGGQVRGIVRDEAGRAVTGASIVALGATPLPVQARSDTAGQFLLSLPPGDYILRATRDGYARPIESQSDSEQHAARAQYHAGADGRDRASAHSSGGHRTSRDPNADRRAGRSGRQGRRSSAQRSGVAPSPSPAHGVARCRRGCRTPRSSDVEFLPAEDVVRRLDDGTAGAGSHLVLLEHGLHRPVEFPDQQLGQPGGGSWIPTELPHSVA